MAARREVGAAAGPPFLCRARQGWQDNGAQAMWFVLSARYSCIPESAKALGDECLSFSSALQAVPTLSTALRMLQYMFHRHTRASSPKKELVPTALYHPVYVCLRERRDASPSPALCSVSARKDQRRLTCFLRRLFQSTRLFDFSYFWESFPARVYSQRVTSWILLVSLAGCVLGLDCT